MSADQPKSQQSARSFYKLGADLSSTSLESEALLDHRYVFFFFFFPFVELELAFPISTE